MKDDLDHHQYDRNTVDQLSSDFLVLFTDHNEEEKALDLYHWVSAAAAPIPSNQFCAALPVCAVQVYTVHFTANTTK